MKKRVLIRMLALVLVCAGAACAEDRHPGDTVTALFTVTANPNKAVQATLSLAYDENALRLLPTGVFRDGRYTWTMIDIDGFPIGSALPASFQIKENAQEGGYTIRVIVTDPLNLDMKAAAGLTLSSYTISVAEDPQKLNWRGNDYYYGRGVTQDYAEAVKWYRKSAEQGYTIAQSQPGALL